MLEILDFGIKDAVDIVAVAILLFYLYRVLRRSRSLYVFVGIVIFLLLYMLVKQTGMKLLGGIFEGLYSAGIIAIIVIFQEEIRRFFYTLGTNERVRKFITSFHTDIQNDKEKSNKELGPIVHACMNMARAKVGALIVIEKEMPLEDIVKMEEVMDAKISQRLIENIFYKNSPLHDGAMIISKGRIKAAACILPVSHDYDIPKDLGLRHRAALGISQQCDAMAIVVSEQTGRIAVAEDGRFSLRLTSEQLEQLVMK